MTPASISTAAPVSVRVSAGLDAMSALEAEWRALFASADCEPAMSFEWTQALARTYLTDSDVCRIVELRRGGTLVGLVPFYARQVRVFGPLRHAVLRPLAELKNTHSDLLLAERTPQTAAALLSSLAQLDCRWDSLRMSKLVEEQPITPLLEDGAPVFGYTPRRRYRKAAYWLRLPATFDDYFASRSQKFRNHARRAEKKLRAAGRVEEVEVTTPEEFDAGYEALLHVERASWKESHGTSMSAVPRQAELYREWGRAAAASGQVHLQLLLLDGEPIAHNLGCIHRGRYYYLKTSYAARHRPLSPPTFLRLALVRSMIRRGLTEIDFCGTPYEWEQQWTDTYRWHHVLSIYANTWRGRLFGALDRWTHYSSSGRTIEHGDARTERTAT